MSFNGSVLLAMSCALLAVCYVEAVKRPVGPAPDQDQELNVHRPVPSRVRRQIKFDGPPDNPPASLGDLEILTRKDIFAGHLRPWENPSSKVDSGDNNPAQKGFGFNKNFLRPSPVPEHARRPVTVTVTSTETVTNVLHGGQSGHIVTETHLVTSPPKTETVTSYYQGPAVTSTKLVAQQPITKTQVVTINVAGAVRTVTTTEYETIRPRTLTRTVEVQRLAAQTSTNYVTQTNIVSVTHTQTVTDNHRAPTVTVTNVLEHTVTVTTGKVEYVTVASYVITSTTTVTHLVERTVRVAGHQAQHPEQHSSTASFITPGESFFDRILSSEEALASLKSGRSNSVVQLSPSTTEQSHQSSEASSVARTPTLNRSYLPPVKNVRRRSTGY